MKDFLHGYDMFLHVININDYICHFKKEGIYSKIHKYFGQIVRITDKYFFYKEKSSNKISKCKQYNCVKIDKYSYKICNDEQL